jgi:predicted nucleic acid-binding protein
MPKLKFAWESTIFITHLTGEERTPEEISGLREIVDMVDQHRATIVTSTLVHGEVFSRGVDQTVEEALTALFKKPSFVQLSASPEIMHKVGQIRRAVLDQGLTIKTPDATFIATALAARVEALHSFDERHLLRLSGLPAVDGLIICKPHGTQTLLGL